MRDLDDNELVTDAFASFTNPAASSAGPSAGSSGQAEGTADIRRIVARRRKTRYTALLVIGALLVAVPIAAFAANPRGNQGPPVADHSPSPEPSVALSPSPSASPSVSPTPFIELTAEELNAAQANAQLNPPAWADICAGVVFFTNAVHTNLDNDAGLETAAIGHCEAGDLLTTQVVAFERDAGGKIVVMGQIARIKAPARFTNLAARAGGGVTATVTREGVTQQRGYAWDGVKFKQVSGPTEFPPPTDLMITVTDRTPVVVPDLPDCHSEGIDGSYTITVRNIGNTNSTRFYVVFDQTTGAGPNLLGSNASGWVRTKLETRAIEWHAPLKPGESATFTLTTTMWACEMNWSHLFTIFGEYADSNPANDKVYARMVQTK